MTRFQIALLAVVAVILVGALMLVRPSSDIGQQATAPSPDQPLKVTTTFYPLAEFARAIGGTKVNVHNLAQPGAEPHDFEPTPQDRVRLQESQVIVYNGAGLEPWLENLTADLADQILVNTTQGLPLLQASNQGYQDNDHTESAHSAVDPHVWLDPVLATQQAAQITRALIKADASNTVYYQQHQDTLSRELSHLDREFRAGLAECESRQIVTSHDAFQYLAKRYNLTVQPIAGLSPDEEPSARKLAEVADFVKQHHVQYIFFESLVSPKLAETIAQETGAKTLAFNPLEGLTDTELAEGKNYFSIQRQNLAALRTALRCK